jgi:hypothetical protein
MGMSVEDQTDAMPGARRGSIQAAELILEAGGLTCDRDAPMRIRLLPPSQPATSNHDLRWRVQRLELTAQPHRGTVRDGLLSHLRRVCS